VTDDRDYVAAKSRALGIMLAVLSVDGVVREARIGAELNRLFDDGPDAVGGVIGFLLGSFAHGLEQHLGTAQAIEELARELVAVTFGREAGEET
jgi:hypothetical protein